MCTPIGCPIELKPTEFPKQCNASDYIKFKKDKAITVKYVQSGYPSTFPQYTIRNDIRWGRTWNDLCASSCVNGKIPDCGTWYVCNPKTNAYVAS